ncbi:HK97 gp10 family phage protein [Mycolicibacterium neoaurum]|uniref:HK97 gp10 family phage protein n=1 Tax=Mycolicibacterium neoaurum TaxID=1795 RepID=UPI001F4C7FA5|nr:HK97 gp10 family phage protein [Mycolicibacterium neoaurum]
MPTLTIDVESRQVEAMLKIAPQKVRSRIINTLLLGAIETQRELRIAAPVGVTADLRKSVKYEVNEGDLSAKIGPTAKYADPIEFGSRPHWVSVAAGSPLRDWADAKGINPYAVQRSIAKKGTKAHPFVKPTHTLMEPRISRRFDTEFAKLSAELSRG